MQKKVFLSVAFLILILTSCNSKHSISQIVDEQINSMAAGELINELLIVNNVDYNQLARIFKCDPASLKRIKSGETYATNNAEIQLQKLVKSVKENGIDALDDVDPYHKTVAMLLRDFSKSVLGIVIIIIIGFVIWAVTPINVGLFNTGGLYLVGGVVVIGVIFFILYVIAPLFAQEPSAINQFTYILDPVWEVIK